MDFKIEKKESYTLVKITAETLDGQITPTLKTDLVVLSGKGEKNILLDISNCSSCDLDGVGAITTADRLCKNSGGVFVLGGVNQEVERILTINQLDRELNISYKIENADAMLLSLLK